MTSKNHLVPSKSLSIPRLELMSCVLLAKLVSSVQDALVSEVSVENLWLWSDSKVALCWIKQAEKKWKIWIQNRVEVIREAVDVGFTFPRI